MKKKLLFLALFHFIVSHSQFNPSTPWSVRNESQNSHEIKFEDEVTRFNNYWEHKDQNKKGSGYKPFKRWEEHWKNQLTSEGKIPTPKMIKEAIEFKIQAKLANRNNQNNIVPISNWEPIGPYNNGEPNSIAAKGRVNVVAVDPNNSNTIYFGSPAGGIWKSTNQGVSWVPLSDNIAQIGVSGIVVDPTNSNIIYIATGDRDSYDTYSIGVLKSTNGGQTWNTTGLTFNDSNTLAGDIIIHPTNNQILLCNTNQGIYRTSNGGSSWSKIIDGAFASGSIRFKPNNPDIVYAVANNNGLVFYKSTNNGLSFNLVNTTIPSDGRRIIMDVTAADSNYVYIAVANDDNTFNGIYRSIDSGVTFEKRTEANSVDVFNGSKQAWYDFALAVSPTNKEEIYLGSLNIWRSSDGGRLSSNWTQINEWHTRNQSYTHADIHFLKFMNNKLYCGSDGGIYVSSNRGVSFTDLTSNANITQFYKIASAKNSTSKIAGGSQDNGGWSYNSTISDPWRTYHGGDGMDCAISPLNENLFYGFMQGGSTLFISGDSGLTLRGYAEIPTGENGNWVTPLTTNFKGEVFAAFRNLYKLNANNYTWVKQNTGSLGEGYENTMNCLEISASNENIIYMSKKKELYKSTNKGASFTLVYTARENILSVNIHATNTNIIYITTGTLQGQVLKSTNGGSSFTSFSENLPLAAKFVIKHQAEHTKNPLYLGTSIGVYYRDDTMISWEPFDTNLPNVPVKDLEINLTEKVILAGTYGRGVWKSKIPAEGLSIHSFEQLGFSISPNPSNGLYTITSGEKDIDKVQVYDVTGKTILSMEKNIATNTNETIDLTNTANGVYFVKIISKEATAIQKIIKN